MSIPRSARQFAVLAFGFFFLFSLTGCEAFAKKFIRKSKKDKEEIEMVLAPEEYPSLFKNKEEEYRQYFLYWQSWQDEFINALLYQSSHKKKLTCLDEALKNITHLRGMLLAEKQKEIDRYIKSMRQIRSELAGDRYSRRSQRYQNRAEKTKRYILKNYSYIKVKDYLR